MTVRPDDRPSYVARHLSRAIEPLYERFAKPNGGGGAGAGPTDLVGAPQRDTTRSMEHFATAIGMWTGVIDPPQPPSSPGELKTAPVTTTAATPKAEVKAVVARSPAPLMAVLLSQDVSVDGPRWDGAAVPEADRAVVALVRQYNALARGLTGQLSAAPLCLPRELHALVLCYAGYPAEGPAPVAMALALWEFSHMQLCDRSEQTELLFGGWRSEDERNEPPAQLTCLQAGYEVSAAAVEMVPTARALPYQRLEKGEDPASRPPRNRRRRRGRMRSDSDSDEDDRGEWKVLFWRCAALCLWIGEGHADGLNLIPLTEQWPGPVLRLRVSTPSLPPPSRSRLSAVLSTVTRQLQPIGGSNGRSTVASVSDALALCAEPVIRDCPAAVELARVCIALLLPSMPVGPHGAPALGAALRALCDCAAFREERAAVDPRVLLRPTAPAEARRDDAAPAAETEASALLATVPVVAAFCSANGRAAPDPASDPLSYAAVRTFATALAALNTALWSESAADSSVSTMDLYRALSHVQESGAVRVAQEKVRRRRLRDCADASIASVIRLAAALDRCADAKCYGAIDLMPVGQRLIGDARDLTVTTAEAEAPALTAYIAADPLRASRAHAPLMSAFETRLKALPPPLHPANDVKGGGVGDNGSGTGSASVAGAEVYVSVADEIAAYDWQCSKPTATTPWLCIPRALPGRKA
jgi:hypothetical protein